MASAGNFPWRWVIAGLAIAVVAVTILVPPPGADAPEEETAAAPDTADLPEAPELTIPDTVRVLVLNGTYIDGLAGRTQRMLLRSSSDSTVILAPFDPGDAAEKPYEETVVISHVPDLSSAAVVASILGVPEDRMVWEVPPAGGADVEVTVCLGRDVSGEIPESEQTE